MAISPLQKRAIEDVIQTICSVTKSRRKICDMFMELVDRDTWPEYYKVIPEPRCLLGIRTGVEKGKYKDSLLVYDDLMLVFANALHYNEQGSQIARDASTLKKGVLEETWKSNSALPTPPPPSPPVTATQQSPAIAISKRQPLTVSESPSRASTSIIVPPAKRTSQASTVHTTQTQGIADEDGDMSPEPQENEVESHSWEFAARDEESAEIIRQLERGLPRWEGGHDKGWMEDVSGDLINKYIEILTLLKNYKTSSNQHPWLSLQKIPEDAVIKDLPSNVRTIGVKGLRERARSQHYTLPREFDQDLGRLFQKGRRWYATGSEGYGKCILLQRVYHLLTSPPFPNSIPHTTSNFSSVTAGPGVAKPLHSQAIEASHAVTTFRIPTKDRVFTDELIYKGMTIRMGDWVHLMNPDEPAKPIIGQVFKTWTPEGDAPRKTQQGLTVCWYFRPEQTIHPRHRQFWENEIFKTGHFADHVCEDIIEKIACQFTAKHVRGRPRPPYWYPGWPLYVCDSRYNDRERVFVKIKNWNSCIPEEFRKNDFMPIYPFERIVYPKRYPSPFVSGMISGPGGIGDSIERAEGEKIEGGGTGRKRPRRTAAGQATDQAGPRYGTFVGTPTPIPDVVGNLESTSVLTPPVQMSQQKKIEDRSIKTALGGASASIEVLPGETVKHFDRDPETSKILWFSGPPIDVARAPMPRYSLKYLHYLSMKKRGSSADKRVLKEAEADEMEIEEGSLRPQKILRMEARPRVTETFATLWGTSGPTDGLN
ncbi:hypothetical protein BU17DRAFT_42281 [Hysterangium stoloniferum]|nr:hypothetical protein BU17DRAFT_42281 [Hysterangium stoloniferum]